MDGTEDQLAALRVQQRDDAVFHVAAVVNSSNTLKRVRCTSTEWASTWLTLNNAFNSTVMGQLEQSHVVVNSMDSSPQFCPGRCGFPIVEGECVKAVTACKE